MALKMGECWNELNFVLINSNVKPTTLDQQILYYLNRKFQNWIIDLQQNQSKTNIIFKKVRNRIRQ